MMSRTRLTTLLCCSALLLAGGAQAVERAERVSPNHDARVAYNESFEVPASFVQSQALEKARDRMPDLMATLDGATGVTRTLYNRSGYLTGRDGRDALAIALDFVTSNASLLGLAPGDLGGHEVSDVVRNRATGSTHVYLRQTWRGLPLYNGQLQVNINRDGRVLGVNNAFLPDLGLAANTSEPALGAGAAVARAREHLGLGPAASGGLHAAAGGVSPSGAGAAGETRLMLLPVRRGEARLVWNFQLATPDGAHFYDMTVDAVDGRVWTRFDWVDTAQPEYTVYPLPVESPNHTTPAPPADGRVTVLSPADATASPLGWHDDGSTSYTITRGNNAHAYEDRDGNNVPPAVDVDCGPDVHCNFPIDLTLNPPAYIPAAVTNLFYWNNIIHDVQFQYGFDEAGGNFQVSNFGPFGLGGDDVRAEAQDNDLGGANCNANFLTPPDGSRPRMQMYTCDIASPEHDGDLDNAVIVHEYGHGISNRQVGGPGNVSCLNNIQQAGEGWSDWFALAYTAEVGDAGPDPRGIGTYLFGQPPNGPGIRPFPYSTSFAVNPHTYSAIGSGVSVPHGVGSVWAEILWEAYWELVDFHGFDPDLYDAFGGAGNQRMMLYVNEGLQNTACSPTFLDGRDGILQAAMDNFGGEDVCRLWEAFARRGLGVDATTGGPNSLTATDGFEVPLECQCQPAPIADAGPDQVVCQGASVEIGTPPQPFNTYVWAPGGEATAQITVAPLFTTTYTVTATTQQCGSDSDSATVFPDDGQNPGLSDDFEAGAGAWTTSGLWHLTTDSDCAQPFAVGYASPLNAFYYGRDDTCTYATGTRTAGDLTSPILLGITADSTLSFDYFRRVEFFPFGAFDATRVDVVTSEGDETTVFSLDSTVPSQAAWVNSGPISLAAFAGEAIQVRFRFDSSDGLFNNFNGWFIDNVVVTGESDCDRDGDGLPNPLDECPDSDLSPEVVIDGCATGVANALLDTGCTILDLIGQCADGASNHGGFVSCVAHLTNDLKSAGVITGAEKGAIQSCAAQADIP